MPSPSEVHVAEKLIVTRDAAREAGRLVAERLVEADAGTQAARLAVTGGSAAAGIRSIREHLPAGVWSRLKLTWIDERCVPFASPDSNRGTAYRDGLLSESEKPRYELPLFKDDETPEKAVSR